MVRKLVPFILGTLFFVGGFSSLKAQQAPIITPIITWTAATFVPSNFKEKALPTRGSEVVMSLDAVRDSALVDFSRDTISWYQNGNYVTGGLGKTSVSVTASGAQQGNDRIRVMVEGINQLETSLLIPVAQPRILLKTRTGPPKNIEAVPLFFNVVSLDNLLFTWDLTTPTESGVGKNSQVVSGDVRGYVIVQNKNRVTEFVRAFIQPPL